MIQPAQSKYLDSASDEVLPRTFPAAISKPGLLSKEAMLKLAEWYMTLSDDAGDGGKELMLRRAQGYYKRFLGLHKAKDELSARAELGLRKIGTSMPRSQQPDWPAGDRDSGGND